MHGLTKLLGPDRQIQRFELVPGAPLHRARPPERRHRPASCRPRAGRRRGWSSPPRGEAASPRARLLPRLFLRPTTRGYASPSRAFPSPRPSATCTGGFLEKKDTHLPRVPRLVYSLEPRSPRRLALAPMRKLPVDCQLNALLCSDIFQECTGATAFLFSHTAGYKGILRGHQESVGIFIETILRPYA